MHLSLEQNTVEAMNKNLGTDAVLNLDQAENIPVRRALAKTHAQTIDHVLEIGQMQHAEAVKIVDDTGKLNNPTQQMIANAAWCLDAGGDFASLAAASQLWRRRDADYVAEQFDQRLQSKTPEQIAASMTAYLEGDDVYGAAEVFVAYQELAQLDDTSSLIAPCNTLANALIQKGWSTLRPNDAQIIIDALIMTGEEETVLRDRLYQEAEAGGAEPETLSVFAEGDSEMEERRHA